MKKIILLILLLCSFGCYTGNAQQPLVKTVQQLTDSIQVLMQQQKITGLMLGITTKDSVIFCGGFGYADVSAQRRVDSNTLFRMGSITKMMVSIGIMQLIKEGKLGLQDELKKVAPEIPFENRWENASPLRIIHLLEHTSGFDDIKLNRMYQLGGTENIGMSAVQAQKNSMVCRWQPGERYAYSNPNYTILGYLIQKFTRMPYREYLQKIILQPLGMQQSNFNVANGLPANTKEYIIRNGQPLLVPSVTIPNGASGALWSNATDMLRFIQCFLRQGSPLLTDSMLTQMETPHSSIAAKAGLRFGYGLGNRQTGSHGAYTYFGHDGLVGTCYATCSYNRTTGVGFILASNCNNDNAAIRQLITDFIEQQVAPAQLYTPVVPTDVPALAPYLGYYQLESPRNEISAFKDRLLEAPRLYVKDGQLYYKLLHEPAALLQQTGPLQFTWQGNNTATMVFTKNADGQSVLSIAGYYYVQQPPFKYWIIRIALALAVLLLLASFPIAIASIIAGLRKKISWQRVLMQCLPAIAVIALLTAVWQLLEVQQSSYLLYQLTDINKRTLLIFLGTTLYAVLSIVFLVWVLRRFKGFRHRWAIYLLCTAIALEAIAIYLWQAGWIGMRVWAM